MNPTPNEVPELPEGYRIIPREWLEKNPLPDDALTLNPDYSDNGWLDSSRRNTKVPADILGHFTYATRAPLPASVPSAPEGYRILTDEEKKQPLPVARTLVWLEDKGVWAFTPYAGQLTPFPESIYAAQIGGEPCALTTTTESPANASTMSQSATTASATPAGASERSANVPSGGAAEQEEDEWRDQFQERVRPWLLACFGEEIANDKQERSHRFIEEALEFVQSCGCTASEAHQLVDYVFNRPAGEMQQEAGGVMVTMAALCLAQGLNMHRAGETELERIWTKVEKIRAKQAAKPKHSPLPCTLTPAPMGEKVREERAVIADLTNECKELERERDKALADLSALRDKADAMAEALKMALERFRDEDTYSDYDYTQVIAQCESALTNYTGTEAKRE
jgi:hypothetical protein